MTKPGNTNKNILYFVYEPIDEDPPCVSQVCILRDLGYSVHVLTKQCHPPMQELFRQKGITWESFDVEPYHGSVIYKARKYLSLQHHLRQMFKERWNQESIFWIGSDRTVVVPGQRRKLRRHHPLVLSCLEYYETAKWQNIMRPIATRAEVILSCEKHRAKLMQEAWHLKKLPYVLPNKPYQLQVTRQMSPSTPQTRQAVSTMQALHQQGRKILLYQGLISEERDLSVLASSLNARDTGFSLVMMGPESPAGFSRKIREIYPDTVYLGNFYYPQHLEISSYADVGVAYYKDDSVNSRYCAPNKIYEYGALGLPMLCNTVPGLTDTVGQAGAAVCVDYHDAAAVAAALGRIEQHYVQYSEAAHAFYEATDNVATIKEAVQEAFSYIR